MRTHQVLAVFVAAVVRLHGQDLYRVCEKYKSVPIPHADRPTAAQASELATCTSSDLYYGVHVPPDPVRARQCAYLEMDGGTNPDQPIFLGRDLPRSLGSAILIMIYANGRGVSRNFDLTLRFACESGAGGEMAIVPRLGELQAQNWQVSDFDLCSEPGMLNATDCRLLAARMKESASRDKLNAILSKWSASDKSEFAEVQTTVEEFFASRTYVECDMLSANYNRYAVEVYAELVEGLAAALARFEEGAMPRFTHADAVNADVELNRVYAVAIKQRRERDRQSPRGWPRRITRTNCARPSVSGWPIWWHGWRLRIRNTPE